MRTRRGLPALVLGLMGLAFAWGIGFGSNPGPAQEARAEAPRPTTWTFEIGRAQDIPRPGVEERMFAFLFEVTAEGAPELSEAYCLRGRAPQSRPSRDLSRTYQWRLLDAQGKVLEEGKHTDRLAVYTPTEDGPCQKDLIGEHAMMIRTAWHADARRIQLKIDGEQGETIEEHDHR